MTIIQVFDLLIAAITAVFGYAKQLFQGLELMPFLIGGFAIFTIYRLLIVPFLGSGASDPAKKSKGDKGNKGDKNNG